MRRRRRGAVAAAAAALALVAGPVRWWTPRGGFTLGGVWNVTLTRSGDTVIAAGVDWNAPLAPDGSVTFGSPAVPDTVCAAS
ncbi:cellulose binding domain-containing protein [Streptomyces sp. CNQ085]|uniref:cellulose binding domain-containing protein n=1 Tax=Streptomyces sp. CNQ085 TaxID=2886944 RepID=UPI001F5048A2|nr:cellulose binding domain-containing protein [Streptomyces sp. CNQ085]MCI0383060.1 cellulose binding domain-containing protein [Streptomyces sp. CNQ085]